MEQEIEITYNVPDNYESDCLMNAVRSFSQLRGFTVTDETKSERRITYFDTTDLSAHSNGDTIRKVTGFEDGRIRYDFKTGRNETRKEHNLWSQEDIPLGNLPIALHLPVAYSTISESARISANYHKLHLQSAHTELEISLDEIANSNETFRELEIEFKSGDVNHWWHLANDVGSFARLQEVRIQKYSRILGGRK
jgi:inorganic triphosphatase YgiF